MIASRCRRSIVAPALGLLFFGAVACSSRDDAAPNAEAKAAVAGETSAAAFLTQCDASAPPKAVVAAIPATDQVRVFTQDGGRLIDNGIHIDGIVKPRRVAIRADGKEAAIAWGTIFTDNWGVAVVSLAPDGSAATLVSSITLGDHHSAWEVSYAGNDRIVVAIAGPTDELVTLDRTSGPEVFAEKARLASPGAFTVSLLGGSDPSEILLSHVNLGTERATTIERLRTDANGAFVSQGEVATIGPPTLHTVLHPSGKVAYAQTYDPSDPPTPSDTEGTGLLNVLGIDAAGVRTTATVPMNKLGGSLAIDPQGRFIVLQQYKVEYDAPTNTLVTRNYSLGTATLGPQGEVLGLLPDSAPAEPGLLFDDMIVTPSSHLVIARSLFPGTVPVGAANPLELLAQSRAGVWEVCQRISLPGGARVAIAP